MVKHILLILFIISNNIISGQTDSTYTDEEIITTLETPPIYKRNDDLALMKMIYSELNFSEFIKNDTIAGQIFISFIIDTLGKTSSHKIIKGIREDIDDEVLRVSRMIKFEKPAMQSGKPVIIQYYLPIKLNFPATSR